MRLLLIVLILISSCSDNKIDKESRRKIPIKELMTVLDTNNADYIKKVFGNYDIDINDTSLGYTLLDKYQNYLNREIMDIIVKKGGKFCSDLNAKNCKINTLKDKLILEVNSNPYYKNRIIHPLFKDEKIEKIISDIIVNKEYDLLKFAIKNGLNLNKKIKIKFLNIPENIFNTNNNTANLKVNYKDFYILDYAKKYGNSEIIELLKKHGAKRGCEILKTKCEPIKGDK